MNADDIVAAAIEVGFEQLTLQAVARHLGVSHNALYRYFGSLDDLIVAAADSIATRLRWPEPGPDWQQYLRDEAWVLWNVFLDHPGLDAAVTASGAVPPSVATHFAAACANLVDLGFDEADAVLAADTVYDLTSDVATRTTMLSKRDDGRDDLAARWAAPADDELRRALLDANRGAAADWFARKLDIVLAGIDAVLRS